MKIHQVSITEIDPESQTVATSTWYVCDHTAGILRAAWGAPHESGLFPFAASLEAADKAAQHGAVFMAHPHSPTAGQDGGPADA